MLATAVLVLIAAGCAKPAGNRDEVADQPERFSASDIARWCNVLETFRRPGGMDEIDILDAPEVLWVSLEFITEEAFEGPSQGDMDPSTAEVAEANATVDAWSHEYCGTDPPLCRLLSTVDAVFSELNRAASKQLIDEVNDDLIQFAPEPLVPYVQEYVVVLDSSVGGPTPADFDEREGAAASDAVHEWTSSHCSDG